MQDLDAIYRRVSTDHGLIGIHGSYHCPLVLIETPIQPIDIFMGN
jgi:hypothetical protein